MRSKRMSGKVRVTRKQLRRLEWSAERAGNFVEQQVEADELHTEAFCATCGEGRSRSFCPTCGERITMKRAQQINYAIELLRATSTLNHAEALKVWERAGDFEAALDAVSAAKRAFLSPETAQGALLGAKEGRNPPGT
jgi:hypothetical protein